MGFFERLRKPQNGRVSAQATTRPSPAAAGTVGTAAGPGQTSNPFANIEEQCPGIFPTPAHRDEFFQRFDSEQQDRWVAQYFRRQKMELAQAASSGAASAGVPVAVPAAAPAVPVAVPAAASAVGTPPAHTPPGGKSSFGSSEDASPRRPGLTSDEESGSGSGSSSARTPSTPHGLATEASAPGTPAALHSSASPLPAGAEPAGEASRRYRSGTVFDTYTAKRWQQAPEPTVIAGTATRRFRSGTMFEGFTGERMEPGSDEAGTDGGISEGGRSVSPTGVAPHLDRALGGDAVDDEHRPRMLKTSTSLATGPKFGVFDRMRASFGFGPAAQYEKAVNARRGLERSYAEQQRHGMPDHHRIELEHRQAEQVADSGTGVMARMRMWWRKSNVLGLQTPAEVEQRRNEAQTFERARRINKMPERERAETSKAITDRSRDFQTFKYGSVRGQEPAEEEVETDRRARLVLADVAPMSALEMHLHLATASTQEAADALEVQRIAREAKGYSQDPKVRAAARQIKYLEAPVPTLAADGADDPEQAAEAGVPAQPDQLGRMKAASEQRARARREGESEEAHAARLRRYDQVVARKQKVRGLRPVYQRLAAEERWDDAETEADRLEQELRNNHPGALSYRPGTADYKKTDGYRPPEGMDPQAAQALDRLHFLRSTRRKTAEADRITAAAGLGLPAYRDYMQQVEVQPGTEALGFSTQTAEQRQLAVRRANEMQAEQDRKREQGPGALARLFGHTGEDRGLHPRPQPSFATRFLGRPRQPAAAWTPLSRLHAPARGGAASTSFAPGSVSHDEPADELEYPSIETPPAVRFPSRTAAAGRSPGFVGGELPPGVEGPDRVALEERMALRFGQPLPYDPKAGFRLVHDGVDSESDADGPGDADAEAAGPPRRRSNPYPDALLSRPEGTRTLDPAAVERWRGAARLNKGPDFAPAGVAPTQGGGLRRTWAPSGKRVSFDQSSIDAAQEAARDYRHEEREHNADRGRTLLREEVFRRVQEQERRAKEQQAAAAAAAHEEPAAVPPGPDFAARFEKAWKERHKRAEEERKARERQQPRSFGTAAGPHGFAGNAVVQDAVEHRLAEQTSEYARLRELEAARVWAGIDDSRWHGELDDRGREAVLRSYRREGPQPEANLGTTEQQAAAAVTHETAAVVAAGGMAADGQVLHGARVRERRTGLDFADAGLRRTGSAGGGDGGPRQSKPGMFDALKRRFQKKR